MLNNKLKMFGQLYRKDMHQLLPELLVVMIISFLLNAAMYFGSEMTNAMLVVPAFLLLGLAGLLPLISSFKIFSHEWSNNNIYLLMSLPASGGMVMGAKLLALISQYIAGTLVVGLGAALSAYHLIPQKVKIMSEFQMIFNNPDTYMYLAMFYLSTVIFMFFLFSVSFLSQTLGKLSRKFSSLITFAAFVALIWMVDVGMDLIGIREPDGIVNSYNFDVIFHNNVLPVLTGYSISYLLAAIILFVGAIIIYDRRLGV